MFQVLNCLCKVAFSLPSECNIIQLTTEKSALFLPPREKMLNVGAVKTLMKTILSIAWQKTYPRRSIWVRGFLLYVKLLFVNYFQAFWIGWAWQPYSSWKLLWIFLRCFNPLVPNAPFLCSLKTLMFLCFQGVEKGCIENEWVRDQGCLLQNANL